MLIVVKYSVSALPALFQYTSNVIFFFTVFYLQFYTSYDNICFSPDDSQVFVSHGKDVVVFNVLEGNKVDEFKKVYNYEVGRACFSPQGQRLIELIMVFDTS